MRPYLLLAVIGIVGCAFGQRAKSARKMPSCTYSGVEVSGDLRTNCAPKSMGQKPAKKYCALTIKGKCAGYVTQDEPCIVTNGTEKGVTSKPCRHAKPVIKRCSGLTGECEVESTEPAGQKPAKKDYLCTGACMTQLDKPEVEVEIKPSGPIDVPAIQATYIWCDSTTGHTRHDEIPKDWDFHKGTMTCRDEGESMHWTCADKERILEHSESGKYYCRKVRP